MKKKDFFSETTPTLLIKYDSVKLFFELDKFSETLQGIFITFPSQISKSLKIETILFERDRTINIDSLERMMTDYFKDKLIRNDTPVTHKYFYLPISITFECVVNGESRLFRQDHFVTFNVSVCGSDTKFEFVNSRFNWRMPAVPTKVDLRPNFKEEQDYIDGRFEDNIGNWRYMKVIH